MIVALALLAGALHFTDATERSGVRMSLTSGGETPTQILEVKGGGLALIDYDNDGDLDLFVPNGATLGAPTRGPGARLFENLGGLRFRDVTSQSGIAFRGWGMGVAVGDVDGNGFDDIYVAAYGPDALLLNDGHKRFRDGTEAAGLGDSLWSTAAALADLDADGRPDVFTTNFADDTNTLRVSLAAGATWDDRTRQYNLGAVSRPFLGWATGFYDFDLDGDEDLLVFNGHVYPAASPDTMDSSYRQTPLLFERSGARFERAQPDRAGPWLAEAHLDRSAAFGDLDGDGDVDVVVAERGGPVRVLENDGARGLALAVSLLDRRSGVGNRHGLGSKVVLRQGDRVQTRWIVSGGSFQAVSAPVACFGLGGEGAVTIEVTWPDGTMQKVERAGPGALTVERR